MIEQPCPSRLAVIENVVRRAQNGQRTLLLGEPGVGKSYVLGAAVDRLIADGVIVLRASGRRLGLQEPWAGLGDFLSRIPPNATSNLAPVQRQALDIVHGSADPDVNVAPRILLLAFTSIVDQQLRDRQVVLAIDDVRSLDRETRHLVRQLFAQPPSAERRLALLGTQQSHARISGDSTDIDTHLFERADVLPLIGLRDDELETALGTDVIRSISPDDWVEVRRLSAGNPRWAQEMIADLTSPSPTATRLPHSIADAVRERVDKMNASAQQVLAAVAILGDPRPQELLHTVPGKEEEVSKALRDGLLSEDMGHVTARLPLMAAAALERLNDDERRHLHATAAANSLPIWTRADHLDLSVEPGINEDIAAALAESALVLRRRGAIRSAAKALGRSLARTPPMSPKYPDRIISLGECQYSMGDFASARDTLQQLRLIELSVENLDRILPVLLDSIAASTGEAAALSLVTTGRQLAHGDPVRFAIMTAYWAEVESTQFTLRLQQAEEALQVLQTADRAPLTQHRLLGLLTELRLDAGTGLDDALLDQSRWLESRNPGILLNDTATAQIGYGAYKVDDPLRSRVALESMMETASVAGETALMAVFHIHLAAVDMLMGDLEGAHCHLKSYDELSPWTSELPPAALVRKGLLAIADDDNETLDALLATAGGPGSPFFHRLTRRALRGLHHARSLRFDEAIPDLEEAITMARSAGFVEPGTRFWVDADLAEAYLETGRLDEAESLIEQLDSLSRRGHRPLISGVMARLDGQLMSLREDRRGAEASLEFSRQAFASSPFRFEEVRTLLAFAHTLSRHGRRTTAHQMLARAEQLASVIGDKPLLRRVALEISSLDAATATILSPVETEIAAAVRDGLSNGEIAALRVNSIRTIESHLTSIYRKLNLRTRGQLAAWVHEMNPGDDS